MSVFIFLLNVLSRHFAVTGRFWSDFKLGRMGQDAVAKKNLTLCARLFKDLDTPAWEVMWLRASDLQSRCCRFESRPLRCQITTLGKLFTVTCFCYRTIFISWYRCKSQEGSGRLCKRCGLWVQVPCQLKTYSVSETEISVAPVSNRAVQTTMTIGGHLYPFTFVYDLT